MRRSREKLLRKPKQRKLKRWKNRRSSRNKRDHLSMNLRVRELKSLPNFQVSHLPKKSQQKMALQRIGSLTRRKKFIEKAQKMAKKLR